MKLITSVMFSLARASHYRGGTYKVIQHENNQIKIVNTQTWKLGSDQYRGGCSESDIVNQVQSDFPLGASCSLAGPESTDCGPADLFYAALFIGDDYCYGEGDNILAKPSGPFTFGWDSCCWVKFTSDQGGRYSGSSMMQYMTVNDVDNNSPTFKLPPLWLIMAGCSGQRIDLAPTDADGDQIRCRWATENEAGGAFHDPSKHASLSLDKTSCTVTYDGTMDQTTAGVKPIALMIEDFDSNGQLRSSIPVQFLAQVWTPNVNTRSIGYDNYPDWFGEHDEHTDHVDMPVRGRRSVPNYCNLTPTFVSPTPADGAQINGSSGSISFELKASSGNGPIDSFSYQAPVGLTCTKVDSQGMITCSWTLTAEQLKTEQHSFCYEATDSLGLVTERRCLNISGSGQNQAEANTNKITNIAEMATAVLDGSGVHGFTVADGSNYGCAGRGTFDAFGPTKGKQVDAADKAFYVWKKCVQCATGNNASNLRAYDYDQANDSCCKFDDYILTFVFLCY